MRKENQWKAALFSSRRSIFIFVPEPEDLGDEKARHGYAFMYGNADDWDVIRDSHEKSMREAIGTKNRIHFNWYYLAPMLEKGLVVRTDPEHPNWTHQEYERI